MVEKYLKIVDEVNSRGVYKPTWESLADNGVPRWFKKAKFGIFIHWGVYSVPAYRSEWYSRSMYLEGTDEFKHHVETYGPQKDFGYKDFIPMFKAEKFDPKAWVSAFKNAGAKYVMPVAEHHDGFQMYKSELSKWNSYEMGPKRDVVGELKEECEKQGLDFCFSSHRAEHWFFMSGGTKFESDIVLKDLKHGDFYWPSMPEQDHFNFTSEPRPTEEYCNDWLARTVELIENTKPSIIYFDWWIQHDVFKPYLLKLIAYYYNRALEWGKEVSVCYKHDALAFGTGIVDMERGKFKDPKPFYWQTDTAIAYNSWCYTETLDYKTPYAIITNLIDIVSKNGNLLLNVGPKANGEIPAKDLEILGEIGKWMDANGEGIYNSTPWLTSSEGNVEEKEGKFSEAAGEYTNEDIRFTAANGCLYAFVLKYDKQEALIKSMGRGSHTKDLAIFSEIESIEVLGFDEKVEYELSTEGLLVKTQNVKTDLPVTFKIKLR